MTDRMRSFTRGINLVWSLESWIRVWKLELVGPAGRCLNVQQMEARSKYRIECIIPGIFILIIHKSFYFFKSHIHLVKCSPHIFLYIIEYNISWRSHDAHPKISPGLTPMSFTTVPDLRVPHHFFLKICMMLGFHRSCWWFLKVGFPLVSLVP